MIRIARERIDDLFGVAAQEARGGHPEVADRCVRLARRIGTRYNVRLLPEYHDLYCRGCSTFWVEGTTVRTRLRRGLRVQTCLTCGRLRRVRLRPPGERPSAAPTEGRAARFETVAIVGEEADVGGPDDEGEEE